MASLFYLLTEELVMIALKNELAKIVESYWDKPYDSTTMKSMEDDIKVHINTHIHDINNSVCVKDNLIYITESFFKKNGGILPFIPYAFSVKEDFFYDLHIGYVHNQQIAFKKVFDINNYGYEITVRDIIKDDKETDVVVEEVNNDGVISLLPHNQKLFNKIDRKSVV